MQKSTNVYHSSKAAAVDDASTESSNASSESVRLKSKQAGSYSKQASQSSNNKPAMSNFSSKSSKAHAHPNGHSFTPDEKPDELTEADQQKLLGSFSAEKGKPVEVVFAFDSTGSMSSCLAQVRSKIHTTVQRLMKDIKKLRIGIMNMGDYCDGKLALAVLDLTGDQASICNFVNNSASTSGGDAAECYELVLQAARKRISWTPEASKALVVIGDCEPHPPSYTTEKIDWFAELDGLAEMGVKIYGVRAMNNVYSEPFYNELCKRTGTVAIRFAQFESIVNMFLAICYREASPQQLQKFEKEISEQGQLNGEMKSIMQNLAQANPTKSKTTTDSALDGLDWWNFERTKNSPPQYTLKNGIWVPMSGGGRGADVFVDATDEPVRVSDAPPRSTSFFGRMFGSLFAS